MHFQQEIGSHLEGFPQKELKDDPPKIPVNQTVWFMWKYFEAMSSSVEERRTRRDGTNGI